VFAAGDELSSFWSCDIVGVLMSVPKSRSGYSTLSGGNDIDVVAVVVVGLAVGLALGLVVDVEIGAVIVIGLVVGAALGLLVGSAVLVRTLSARACSFNTL
jgi:hypothetical protein